MPLSAVALTPVHEVPVDAISIRSLRPEDKEPIRQLLAATEVFTTDEIDIAMELVDVVLQRADQRDYIVNVCEDGGSVLGYYCMGPTPGTTGTFDLYWIAVHPSLHGRGVGGKLDAHAEALARSQGGRIVIAETSSQPKYAATRMFYVHHGYREVARIQDYYRPGDDLVVYGKYLVQL